MRYGYVGYTQLLDGDRISIEKVLKRKKPDPEVKLSKQISALMSTALFQTSESIWRMSPIMPSGMTRLPPARPRGVKQAPNLLASYLSSVFYTNNADYLLKHWDSLDLKKLKDLGVVSRRYGASWQPIYDLVSDDPLVHVKIIKRLLKIFDYPVADNFSTVFCFAFIGLKNYKALVSACPKLLRPYICLLPNSEKEHEVALKWASKKPFIRVGLNASLFAGTLHKKKPVLSRELKIAYREVKETWRHYYGGVFVPLCTVKMEHLPVLSMLAKKCNVVVSDFNPLAPDQYKMAKPKPKPEPVDPKKKKKKKK